MARKPTNDATTSARDARTGYDPEQHREQTKRARAIVRQYSMAVAIATDASVPADIRAQYQKRADALAKRFDDAAALLKVARASANARREREREARAKVRERVKGALASNGNRLAGNVDARIALALEARAKLARDGKASQRVAKAARAARRAEQRDPIAREAARMAAEVDARLDARELALDARGDA